MFKNLRELILSMPTEKDCREYLAKQRWVDGKASCPYCGHNKCYSIEKGERYKCANTKCFKRFKITVGTIFEASNIPLTKWFTAIYLITAHKKGISSHQLGRDISVTQRTAWFMLHRVREMLKQVEGKKLDNMVEADEMYVGGSIANKHVAKRKEYAADPNWTNNKTTVLGMVERNGLAIAKVIEHEDKGEVERVVRENLEYAANLVTDGHSFYKNLNDDYYHYSIQHNLNEFKRVDFHTNTVEGMFSHFKRMVYGIYHQITPKHTQRYLDEFTYRYNSRKVKDAERFALAMQCVNGRLTYKTLINSKIPYKAPANPKPIDKKNFKPVIQRKGDEIIGEYKSLVEAELKTGVYASRISQVIRGKSKKAGGFEWDYLFNFE